jgi:putative transcriptional regulator
LGAVAHTVKRAWKNSRKRNIWMKKLVSAANWDMNPGKRDLGKAKCRIKVCCFRERGLETCADCCGFPCEILGEFWSRKGWRTNSTQNSSSSSGNTGTRRFWRKQTTGKDYAESWKPSKQRKKALYINASGSDTVLYLITKGRRCKLEPLPMSVSPSIREVLARRIAGEIILSNKSGATMRKWRELFAVSQISLSERMSLSSSVISDYESGRRKSPGAKFIRRFVLALLQIDEEKGSRFTREFAKLTSSPSMAIVDLREFPIPVRVEYLCKAIDGEVVACRDKFVKEVSGYTVVDSKKAVEVLSGLEYAQLFGATTDRALVFTNVDNGCLPMMIVRVSSLKPKVVVFHRVKPDDYAVKLAEYEQVPLIYSTVSSVELLVKSLRKLYRIALRIKLGRRIRPPPKISA